MLSAIPWFQIIFFLCVIILIYVSIHKLKSNYPHIFIPNLNVGNTSEAHKWMCSSVTTAPGFPALEGLCTVTLFSNLKEVFSGLRPRRICQIYRFIITLVMFASVTCSHQYRISG
ncbi:hypothetical protein ILYODFUR_002265 [Ilyodon furcidens]|uniref:ATP synthase F0 subunit 8 n=1 Tax=Ilyodon furcidens TaxID=33524 RepID=A0ABV0SHU0_9TELE